jgi:hypothetical protein
MKKSRKRLALSGESIRTLTDLGAIHGGIVTATQTNEDCTGSMNTYCQCGDSFACPPQTYFFCPR